MDVSLLYSVVKAKKQILDGDDKKTHEANEKPQPLWGCGSAEIVDALKCDLFLSIQRCSQIRLTRSLPPRARIGKVAELIRAIFHPECETTPKGNLLQGINRFL
jgi:hypothetical protein